MKAVLLHIHEDDGQEARIQAAIDIVKATKGHMTCLQVTPFTAYVMGDPLGGLHASGSLLAQLRTNAQAERGRIEGRLSGDKVKWNWVSGDGDVAQTVINYSRLADVVVLSRATHAEHDQPLPIVGDVALHARTGILAVSNEAGAFKFGAPAMIAWNGSAEAAHAMRLALPMLQAASAVHIVSAAEDELMFPLRDAQNYLSHHGVTGEVHEWSRENRSVGDAINDAASKLGAGCIVMGAYGHSRLREVLLGGVTRGLLEHSRLPLFLAH